MLTRDVMTSPVITVCHIDTVRRAVQILYDHNITAAPVVDDDGRMVGIVSEMDLLTGSFQPDPRAHERPVPHGTPPPALVSDVMTRDVVTATETTDVTEVIIDMVDKRIKSVPVLRGHEIVGIVSRRDLMAMLARSDDRLREEVVMVLREQYPFGPHWQVTVRAGVAELRGRTGPHTDEIADLLVGTIPGIVRVHHYH